MEQINAFDGDGHVEEWEETFSDKYLDLHLETKDRLQLKQVNMSMIISGRLAKTLSNKGSPSVKMELYPLNI